MPADYFVGWIAIVWNMLNGFADRMALNCLRFSGRVPHQILYHVIYLGFIGTVVAIIPALTVISILRLVKKRRKHRYY